MALDTFVAGHSTGTYNAVAVGLTEDGFKLRSRQMGAPIDASDAFGKTMLDYSFQGVNWFADFTCLAFKPGSISPFSPWATMGTLGSVGKLASDHGTAFVLTAAAGLTASLAVASVTAPSSLIPPDTDGELLFSSVLRKVPVKLQFFPTLIGGVLKHFALG